MLGDADVEGALEDLSTNLSRPTGCIIAAVFDEVLALLSEVDDLVGEDVGPDPALGRLLAGLDVEGTGRWNWSASCCSAAS